MASTIQNYLAVLTSEHNQKPNFVAFVSAICQPSVDAQNLLATFPVIFDLRYAVGDQLDKIGAWVGVSRNLNQMVLGVDTLDDNTYRVLIYLFIAMNTWDGTVPGIYNIWNSILASTYGPILVDDFQDMTMAIVLLVPPTSLLILAILIQGYFLMRPAGVGIIGFFEPSVPSTPVFGFDAETSTVSGFDVGAWVIPVVT
jgi:hypothetical protein